MSSNVDNVTNLGDLEKALSGEIEFTYDPRSDWMIEATKFDVEKARAEAQITPRGDHVILRRRIAKNESKGGILLPGVEPGGLKAKFLNQGTVISVGPDVVNLLPGDEVIISGYEGTNLVGQDRVIYHVIRETEVKAIVSECNRKLLSKSELRIRDERAIRKD